MPLSNQIDVFDLRNVDWNKQRYLLARIDKLKEIERANDETKNRSWGSKEAWRERKLNK